MIQVITQLFPFYNLSEKRIGKIFKFNVKVTSCNYNSSSDELTVTWMTGTPINIEEVQFIRIRLRV